MKNIITALILILISCRNENKGTLNEKELKNSKTTTYNHAKNCASRDDQLKELSLPFCLTIDTLAKSNYYQTHLDTFLMHHRFKRDLSLKINKEFHENTKDFISEKQANYMHYPFKGKGFAISKFIINNKVTAVLYAYLYESEISQPRIEIQTFDKQQKNIDNLIIASAFTSECSGYRNFCISRSKVIMIYNYYYCNDTEYKNEYKYKINSNGMFVLAD